MEEAKKGEVIIIGKNYSTSLGVIRAVGMAGYTSIVILTCTKKPRMKTPELVSKYTEKYYYAIGDKKVLEILDNISDPANKKLIIPTDDQTASLLDLNYENLVSAFYLPSIGEKEGRLTDMMDKNKQKEMARACGLSCANADVVEIDDKGRFVIPGTIVFPCYTKPLYSIGSPKSYIKRCNTLSELEMLLKKIASKGANRILVEEYLDINSEYVVPGAALSPNNIIIPALIKKTKIGSGEHKGVTAMGKPIDGDKRIIEKLGEFISHIEYRGLFDIELIESKGGVYFNELNLRNGAAGYGITANGVNLPGIYVKYILNGSVTDNVKILNYTPFVSEKVELEAYYAGYLSWREYKKDISRDCIHFIDVADDPAPKKAFDFITLKTRVRRLLRK